LAGVIRMAVAETVFACQSCGAAHAKWAGRCDACGEWNTLVEETALAAPVGAAARARKPAKRRRGLEFVDLATEEAPPQRLTTGISELDRVLGGGLTAGSAILVGGDPGIGKSTLLLQAASLLARKGVRVAYVSGEEAVDQVRGRAARL